MSKPRYKWWSYVRRILYDWPRLDELHRDVTAAAIGAPPVDAPRGVTRTAGRATETVALRELSPQEQREFEAIERAISVTRGYADGALRLELVSLVFWRRTHTLEGAALRVGVAYVTARRWQQDFIRETARGLNLL
jgi:hypothetical protein